MLQIKNNNIDSWVVKELLWRRKQPPCSISLGFSALFLHKEPSPLRPKLLVVKSSLFRLLSPVGPCCTKTRQSSEAQRNALLRATRPTTAGLSLQVCMAWCLQTILLLGSGRKSSLTRHSNSPWHRRLLILSIWTSPTIFNTEPSSEPRDPERQQFCSPLATQKFWTAL